MNKEYIKALIKEELDELRVKKPTPKRFDIENLEYGVEEEDIEDGDEGGGGYKYITFTAVNPINKDKYPHNMVECSPNDGKPIVIMRFYSVNNDELIKSNNLIEYLKKYKVKHKVQIDNNIIYIWIDGNVFDFSEMEWNGGVIGLDGFCDGEDLDEMSVSGDAGSYNTPKAFKKQKRCIPCEKKKSKVVDYKYVGPKRESQYDQASSYTAASGYTGGGIQGDNYYKMNEMKKLEEIINKELLNEATYNQFKREAKFRTKSEQLHKAIREVKKKIQEVNRIIEYTSRMKQELSEDGGVNYWKATEKYVGQISEMVNHLSNKLKNLNN